MLRASRVVPECRYQRSGAPIDNWDPKGRSNSRTKRAFEPSVSGDGIKGARRAVVEDADSLTSERRTMNGSTEKRKPPIALHGVGL
jgi:hypothetical protein